MLKFWLQPLIFSESHFSTGQMNLFFCFFFSLFICFPSCLLTPKSVSWGWIMGQVLLLGSHALTCTEFLLCSLQKLLWPLCVQASAVTWLAQGWFAGFWCKRPAFLSRQEVISNVRTQNISCIFLNLGQRKICNWRYKSFYFLTSVQASVSSSLKKKKKKASGIFKLSLYYHYLKAFFSKLLCYQKILALWL